MRFNPQPVRDVNWPPGKVYNQDDEVPEEAWLTLADLFKLADEEIAAVLAADSEE